ncbi:hypothetical protein EXIGLDRAFT_603870, partial [Exidia glandulosa HHB12029]
LHVSADGSAEIGPVVLASYSGVRFSLTGMSGELMVMLVAEESKTEIAMVRDVDAVLEEQETVVGACPVGRRVGNRSIDDET